MGTVRDNSKPYAPDCVMQPSNSTVVPNETVPWLQTIWNGRYQQLFWMGAFSWGIVNHEDREILLIDPWPTYNKTSAAGYGRLRNLANFIRRGNAMKNPYKLVGVLVSHEHFDHANDIDLLYRMITSDTDIKFNDGQFNCKLTGLPYGYDELPPLCCDQNSWQVITGQIKGMRNAKLTHAFGHYESNNFIEILDSHSQSSVIYSDWANQRRKHPQVAGEACMSFEVGHFHVKPYVWDHYSIMDMDAGLFKAAGNLQRQSAFHIWHKDAAKAKRTFFCGSAGEMSAEYTEHVQWHTGKDRIKTDCLIQSISGSKRHMKDLQKYQQKCFSVKDFVVPSHYEKFFTGPDSKKGLKDKFDDKVEIYIKLMKPSNSANKVLAIGRMNFECKLPSTPDKLALEADDFC